MSGAHRSERPATTTAAQERFVTELLAWGQPRPRFDDSLVDELLARLTVAVGVLLDCRETASGAARRPLLVTKTRLTRLVCDGLQRDPLPYEHRLANARGTLAHTAIELDVDGARDLPARQVVEAAWQRQVTDRPGDPRSLAAWLNARDGAERAGLSDEVAALLDDFREVAGELVRQRNQLFV
jgi:hypothetical protein